MTQRDAPRIGTVMLVDDEEIDQMLYGRIVERSEHADQIQSFVDAKAALQHLIEGADPVPDLVLLDINMPGMGGFEFLDAMEAGFDGRQSPFVAILTTSFDPADAERAKASDLVCGYKNKPLTESMLAEFREQIFGKVERVA